MSSPARRKRWPTILGVLLLVAATSATLSIASLRSNSAITLVVVSVAAVAVGYLVGRHMPRMLPAVASFVAVLLVSLPVSYVVPGGESLSGWLVTVFFVLLVVVVPWWVGRSGWLRAEQRISDAAIRAEHAQAEERARIADDLHDTIGHELALIAVQAGALELGDNLGPEQNAQFRALREAAVRASGRLRDVVIVTRPEGSARLEPLGGEGIEALVAGARDAGMTVDAFVDRAVISDAHPLIAELVVRTIREGLTNAARHASGAPVTVELSEEGEEGFAVSIRSAPPSQSDTQPRVQGAGHGIPGLRRRAEMLGGRVDATRSADGGFELRLRTPSRPEHVGPGTARAADSALRSNARTARRRLLQAAVVPAVIVVLSLAGYAVVQAITAAQTRISSEVYASIKVGMPRAELASVLPAGIPEPMPMVAEPPIPEGAECEYFATHDSWLRFTNASYRLCFEQGLIVEKTMMDAS